MATIHKRTVLKGLNDPDNHDGVIIHLEPDILECEVKGGGVLGSITTKLVEVMEFQLSHFKSPKLKCYPQYVSRLEKLSNGYRTGKGQFSFQSQRSAVPKNVQTIVQLCSFPMPVRLC